jgi:photosystem II stability/assembly factor-like uncharacterized protein
MAHRPHDVATQIEVSPTFNQDQTLYIIVRNNLFKSSDQGNSWERLVNGIDNHHELASLSLSKSDKRVLFLSSLGDGIYKSEDGGSSWAKMNNGLQELTIHLVTVSPDSSDVGFAAAAKGLYKTTNRGNSWYPVLENVSVTAIGFTSGSQTILVGDSHGKVYRSDNLGETWMLSTSLSGAGAIRAIALTPDFSTSQTAFAATEKRGVYSTQNGARSFQAVNPRLGDRRMMDLLITSNPEGGYIVLASTWNGGYWQYKSTQKTWTQFSNGLSRDKMADDLKVPHFEDLEISNSFATDGLAFLGGFDGLFRTENGGSNWIELETLSKATIVDLAISPTYANDSTLAVTTYVGGLYMSNNGGNTWNPINQNLFVQRFKSSRSKDDEAEQDPRRFFDIAFSPNYSSDHSLFTTILWSKLLRSTNQGQNWSIVQLPREVRGPTIAVSPNFTNDTSIYVSTQGGFIFKSTNGGKTFKQVSKIDRHINNNSPSLVISPAFAVDKTLFSTGSKGIYQSTDQGRNWQLLSQAKIPEGSDVQLVISPNYPNDSTLFAGTQNGLYVTRDTGHSWQEMVNHVLGENPYIEAIAISPDYGNDRTFLVSVRGQGLFKTVDGGQSFESIGDPLLSLSRVHNIPSAGYAVQFSPNYAVDKTLYGFGSASSEIFKSTDGGATWNVITIQRHEIGEPNFIQSIGLFLSFHHRKLAKGLLVAALCAGIVYLLQKVWLGNLKKY